MKLMSRILSLILSFQLLVSCDGAGFRVVPNSIIGDKNENEKIQISGSIASTFNFISNLIIPSSMAATGDLKVYDMTDPLSPIVLKEESINNQTDFTLEFEPKEVQDKLLKIQFISSESPDKSRALHVDLNQNDKLVNIALDEDSTIKTYAVEQLLIDEIKAAGGLNPADVRTRLSQLASSPVDLSLPGMSHDLVSKLLLLDSAKISDAVFRFKDPNSDEQLKKDMLISVYEHMNDYGLYEKPAGLVCYGDTFRAFTAEPKLGSDKTYKVVASPVTLYLLSYLPMNSVLGEFTEAEELIKHVEGVRQTIIDFQNNTGNITAADIKIMSIYKDEKSGTDVEEVVDSCRLYSSKIDENLSMDPITPHLDQVDLSAYGEYNQDPIWFAMNEDLSLLNAIDKSGEETTVQFIEEARQKIMLKAENMDLEFRRLFDK